jgi:hypothetical protein
MTDKQKYSFVQNLRLSSFLVFPLFHLIRPRFNESQVYSVHGNIQHSGQFLERYYVSEKILKVKKLITFDSKNISL